MTDRLVRIHCASLFQDRCAVAVTKKQDVVARGKKGRVKIRRLSGRRRGLLPSCLRFQRAEYAKPREREREKLLMRLSTNPWAIRLCSSRGSAPSFVRLRFPPRNPLPLNLSACTLTTLSTKPLAGSTTRLFIAGAASAASHCDGSKFRNERIHLSSARVASRYKYIREVRFALTKRNSDREERARQSIRHLLENLPNRTRINSPANFAEKYTETFGELRLGGRRVALLFLIYSQSNSWFKMRPRGSYSLYIGHINEGIMALA